MLMELGGGAYLLVSVPGENEMSVLLRRRKAMEPVRKGNTLDLMHVRRRYFCSSFYTFTDI